MSWRFVKWSSIFGGRGRFRTEEKKGKEKVFIWVGGQGAYLPVKDARQHRVTRSGETLYTK